jgi:hypothetical protein
VPRKIFVAGEILTAADVNSNLMDQAVMVFDDATARTTAIPSPIEGMVTYLASTKSLDKRVGSSWIPASNGFTAGTAIVATDASWPVPSLASPIVKVTVIGGGGGGGGGLGASNTLASSGGDGTTTTFNAGGAGTVSATGGAGGRHATSTGVGASPFVFASYNGGPGGTPENNSSSRSAGMPGQGGQIVVSYLNLTGISTVNVTIGAGGTGGAAGGGAVAGGAGGAGVVIVEYVAA